jgi:hypothetical protein
MIQVILWSVLIIEIISIAFWLIMREIVAPKMSSLQREVNLRLTYKRYMELYPNAGITYEEYKRIQAKRAYKKAVSSTKIKRMVR